MLHGTLKNYYEDGGIFEVISTTLAHLRP